MERVGCSNQTECPLRESKLGCREDVDHFWWPASSFRTKQEKDLRERDEFKRRVCRWIHEARHAEEQPPVKPEPEAIRQYLAGAIGREALMGEQDESAA